MFQGDNFLKKAVLITLISSLVTVSDYLTKRLIVERVMPFEHIDVLPFLRIVHVRNEGAAFGTFTGLGNDIFIFISVIAIIFIIVYLSKTRKRLEFFSLSLILGGAAGNLIDRIKRGGVVDFIDVFAGKWHWPAFNLADSALTTGIALFLLSVWRHERNARKENR